MASSAYVKMEESPGHHGGLGTEIRELLVDSMQDIASSVSQMRYSEILCGAVKKEMHDEIQSLCFQELLSHVGHIERNASDLNIGQQMKNLQKLSSEYPRDHIAWRPTAGTVNINSIEANALKSRKKQLLEKMEAIDSENDILRQTIIAKRKVLEEQRKNLSKIDVEPLIK